MESTEVLRQEIGDLQNQVRQQEKLAALGMLTAGIMHEIRNPMNFIMNFSALSKDLLADLEEDLRRVAVAMDEAECGEVREILADLHENLEKIREHGARAMSVVQNVLLYSRGRDDVRVPSDVCSLVKEYVWLGFHAMRANYPDFNVSISEDYPEDLPRVEVVPQDLTRAVLNVLNNAYYAVWERARSAGSGYAPKVAVSVAMGDGELCIRIADNGLGMTREVKARLYESFFTTKPVGHGTGLGMAITRDIIENKHHGRIAFVSEENVGTTFSLFIPLKI